MIERREQTREVEEPKTSKQDRRRQKRPWKAGQQQTDKNLIRWKMWNQVFRQLGLVEGLNLLLAHNMCTAALLHVVGQFKKHKSVTIITVRLWLVYVPTFTASVIMSLMYATDVIENNKCSHLFVPLDRDQSYFPVLWQAEAWKENAPNLNRNVWKITISVAFCYC